jgi:hypothetical protein
VPSSEVECAAAPDVVWDLMASPARWHEWSPYVAGAEGLGEPRVEPGRVGSVVLRGGVRMPARVVAVVPGRSWTWEAAGLRIAHTVTPRGEGSRIRHDVASVRAWWSAAAFAYLPVVALIARNLARVAERQAGGGRSR